MNRASSENVVVWITSGLIGLYALGYLTLRVTSDNQGSNVILPLSMMTRLGSAILKLYEPVYLTEGRLRRISFWRMVAPPPPDGMSWSEYQILQPK